MERTVEIQVLQCSDCQDLQLGVKQPGDSYTAQRINTKAHCSGEWNILHTQLVPLGSLEPFAVTAAAPKKKPNKAAKRKARH